MALFLIFLLLLTRTSATYYGEESDIVLDRQIKGNITQLDELLDHGLEMPYVEDLKGVNYDFGGSTVIDLNQYCRLTQRRKSQAGYLSSHRPLISTQFQIDVELSIGGTDDTMFGDGLAIWLIEKGIKNTGPVFGAPDYWKGLGLFIDTFPNGEKSKPFPRMMAILNDGSKRYNVENNGQGQESGECHVPRIRDQGTQIVRINYLRSKFLEVLVRYEDPETYSKGAWSHCFTIFDVTLPIRPYVAFSAHTGGLTDTHDIVNVLATQIHHEQEQRKSTPPTQPRVEKVKASRVDIRIMILPVFLIVAFLGGKRYRRSSEKKF